MKKLNLPIFKQKEKMGCGLAALACVFAYLGKKISQKGLLREIKIGPYGSFNADLGRVAIKYGFKAKVFSLDIELLYKKLNRFLDKKPGIKELERLLKNLRGEDKEEMGAIIKFIKAGGDYQIRVPDEEMLVKAIDAGSPPIISVNSALFFGESDYPRQGHYLVVTGYDKEYFWVADVYYKREVKIGRNKLFVGWVLNAVDSSSYILLIGKS